MKKTILIIALMMICFGLKAIAGNDENCYVKTRDNTFVGADIKIGLNHTRLVQSDGAYREFKNREVIAYRHHNKLYMMMPVVCNNTDTLCMAMMEYITSKSGCIVYKYSCSKEEDRLTDANKNYFFVYKDGKYYCRIDEDQTEALKAFGIIVI